VAGARGVGLGVLAELSEELMDAGDGGLVAFDFARPAVFGGIRPLSHARTIRNIVEQGVLADQIGIDFFGLGEHHTDDFPLSTGDVVLGAIAARTTRIHLGSAVTVLSSDDPVRVFQRYSTLNAISGGRAEVILGQGSSTDSFPLFGYDLADRDILPQTTVWALQHLTRRVMSIARPAVSG
jgi:hypothetical protein